MQKMFLFILAFICLPGVMAQTESVIPELDKEDLPGAVFNRNDVYDGRSLWGYMNGGADLYIEYGFVELRVQEFEIENEMMKAEIYRMKNPASAFGIYSIKIYKCNDKNIFISPDCLSNYQYQAAKGPVYISVINASGSEKAVELTKKTAEIIAEKVVGRPFRIEAFNMLHPDTSGHNQIKLVKGKLGLQNSIPRWQELFREMVGYEVYMLKIENDKGKITLAEVEFPSESQRETFILQNIPDADPEKEKLFFTYKNRNFGILQTDERHIRMYETKAEADDFKTVLEDFGF